MVILIWKFLSQVESDLKTPRNPNLSREECHTVRSLADDRNIVIKRGDRGSCVVIWDRNDYVKEAEIQLSNQNVYKSVEFKDKILTELVEKSNQRASVLYIQIQKKTSLGKMYVLPKIHERLFDVSVRPVISNCGTPTEKVSEFLDHHLKPVI